MQKVIDKTVSDKKMKNQNEKKIKQCGKQVNGPLDDKRFL